MKTEHQTIITPQEEYSLRLYALQIVVQMLRNINKTIEAENAEFKIAQSKYYMYLTSLNRGGSKYFS